MGRDLRKNQNLKNRQGSRRQDASLPSLYEDDTQPRYERVEKMKTLTPKNQAQKAYLNAIHTQTLTFGLGPAGTGKAQPLDARIKVPGGWAKMGDMKVGSTVTGADGSEITVTAVYPQGAKEIYKITFEDGRSTECCAEHLWRVYRYDWQPENTRWRVVNIFDLIEMLKKPSCKNRLYIQLAVSEQTQDIDLAIDPYLMGCILGDGHIGMDTVGFSSKDVELIQELNARLPEGTTMRHSGRYDYQIRKSDTSKHRGENPFSDALRLYGMRTVKSNEKWVPVDYLNGSDSQRRLLLQGLMDTDGTVDKSGAISFTSVSQALALDVQYLVRSLGGEASISERYPTYQYEGEKRVGQLAYTVHIKVKSPKSCFMLERKRDLAAESNQYSDSRRLRIASIEYVGTKEAQCISVSAEDHLYVTDDFIVTHNTFLAAWTAADMFDKGEIKKIIVTRPAVEAGENLGFLPGELEEKIGPYFVPVLEALQRRLGKGPTDYALKAEQIVFVPLAYMRGRTFDDAFVILDEAQNTTPKQMKMFLTRIGERTKVVVNGDLRQSDIPGENGLWDAKKRLKSIPGTSICTFTRADVVRSGLAQVIVDAYEGTDDYVDDEDLGKLPSFITGSSD